MYNSRVRQSARKIKSHGVNRLKVAFGCIYSLRIIWITYLVAYRGLDHISGLSCILNILAEEFRNLSNRSA